MIIIKLGGSIINPDGKYDDRTINELINLVEKSKEKFIFIVGGGKLCRRIQTVSKKFLKTALRDEKKVQDASDWLGIAVTKINAGYVLSKFKEKLGKKVYPEIILDPNKKIRNNFKIFFAGGWKPGASTDEDTMLLAKTFQAKKVFKITDFKFVKKISPLKLIKLTDKEKKKVLKEAEDIKGMSWKQLKGLVGAKWLSGMDTPFDPQAAMLGYRLRKKLTLYVGGKEELFKALKGEKFRGTVVRG